MLVGTWLGQAGAGAPRVQQWMCQEVKAVRKGEMIMIGGSRMCQWDQTSVSLKYTVFSSHPGFSVSPLHRRVQVFHIRSCWN